MLRGYLKVQKKRFCGDSNLKKNKFENYASSRIIKDLFLKRYNFFSKTDIDLILFLKQRPEIAVSEKCKFESFSWKIALEIERKSCVAKKLPKLQGLL